MVVRFHPGGSTDSATSGANPCCLLSCLLTSPPASIVNLQWPPTWVMTPHCQHCQWILPARPWPWPRPPSRYPRVCQPGPWPPSHCQSGPWPPSHCRRGCRGCSSRRCRGACPSPVRCWPRCRSSRLGPGSGPGPPPPAVRSAGGQGIRGEEEQQQCFFFI